MSELPNNMSITVFIEDGEVTISDLPDELVPLLKAIGGDDCLLKTSCREGFGDDYCG